MRGADNSVDLLERWRRHRDGQAFEELVERHAALVFSACHRMLRNRADAEDVAQECFIQLAQTRQRITVSIEGWLHTAATRRSIDRIRRDTRRRARERQYKRTGVSAVAIEQNEFEGVIDTAIGRLSDELREPLVAYYLAGKSQDAIAAELGLSQSAVSRRIDKAVDAIRTALQERGYTTPSAANLAVQLSGLETHAAPAALISNLSGVAATQTAFSFHAGVLTVGGLLAVKKAAALILVVIAACAGWWLFQASNDAPASYDATPSVPSLSELEQVPSSDGETIAATRNASPTATTSEAGNEPLERREDNVAAEPGANPTPSAGSVAGTVRIGQSGRPAAGYTVTLTRDDAETEVSVTTDARGAFYFKDIEPGTYAVQAQEHGAMAVSARYIDVEDSESLKDVDFLLPGLGDILGAITVAGTPEPNVKVDLAMTQPGVRRGTIPVVTDARGEFYLTGLHEGDYTFFAELTFEDGSTTWSNQVTRTVVAGETSEVNLDFVGGEGVLEGVVTVNYETVTDAEIVVALYEAEGKPATATLLLPTGGDGRYRIEGLVEGDFVVHGGLRLDKGQIRYGEADEIAISAGETATYDFDVTLGTGTLSGQVYIGNEILRGGSLGLEGGLTPISENGTYKVENVNPGQRYLEPHVLAEWGHLWKNTPVETRIFENRPAQLDIAFAGGSGRIDGQVVSESGELTPGAVVATYAGPDGGQEFNQVNPLDDGSFTIQRLPSGMVYLLVFVEGDFTQPAHRIDLPMEEGQRILERILLP